MADTTFVDYQTPVPASWLNDVNDRVYGSGTKYPIYASTLVGADPTGATDNTAILQAAIDTGARLVLNGTFLISSPLEPTQAGIIGIGPELSGLKCNGCHAIQIPSDAGFDRTACLIAGFSINSNDGTSCDAKYAFYMPGVASGAAAVYNSGVTIRDIEIGRTGRFGGGFYVKDVFRLNVMDVGMTDICWMIRLIGSVVQAKFVRVTTNNDTPGSSLNKYGVSTESASYASGTLTPENVQINDCSYIRGERGINHGAGLLVDFNNFDTETSTYGMVLSAACRVNGGIVGPDSTADTWTGVYRGVSQSDADEATIINGLDINCFRAPATPASSYGIDAGDGTSNVVGLTIRDCRFRGTANSLQSAFRGRKLVDCVFDSNFIRTSVVAGTNDVDISDATSLVMTNNRNASGVWSIDDSGASAYGTIQQNNITTLTFSPTTRANWIMDINGAIIRRKWGASTISDGGTIAHGLSSTPTWFQVSGTQQGEFTGVSSVDATNLTVFIKKHDNSAGSSQGIHWEAAY